LAQFEQESLDVAVRQTDEIENVGVFSRLLSHVGIGWRQGDGEVADGLPGAFVQAAVDLPGQHIPGPTVLDRLLRIP
jgi:hypothetical protein